MSTDVNVKTAEKIKTSLKIPAMWKVVFLNDDHTPMAFVIELLTTIFKHNEERATEITLEIHNTGSAVVGVFGHEIAEHKATEATQLSRINGFPLRISIEQE